MQFVISLALVLLVTIVCFLSSNYIGYRVVALLLLVCVSLLASVFDILPVLFAALISSLSWNFFFIPPIFTFHVSSTEDLLMFLMYFVIAMINAILTFKIREAESKARDKDEKEKTIKLYTTLLNSLSHEMRTPIATIIAAIDTLKDTNHGLTKAQHDQLLEEIDRAGMRLNRQVENLLNMNRLETGILLLKKDWCDINELIFTVIQKFNEAVCEHELIFHPSENFPLVKIDLGILENVLQNLIHNAIQYTPKGSIVRVMTAFSNEILTISIEDSGPGIPESELKNVFDKFYRLPNSKAGGAGLGLSIVKGFVEAHGGKIELKNRAEGGVKIQLTLPVEATFISQLKNE